MEALPECASQLHHIVSLAGGALALNLAYVNLERFRYARSAENLSKDMLDKVEIDGKFRKSKSYQELSALVARNLPEKKNEYKIDSSSDSKVGIDTRALRWLHELLFVKPMDLVICCIFVVISVIALALGSGHPIGVLMWTCKYFSTKHDDVYWTLAVGIAAPMLFILFGSCILWKCRTLIRRMEDEFGYQLKKEVPTVALKNEVGNDE